MDYGPNDSILILSDVHGNLDMLRKVLAWADARKINHIWNLGDVYGYRSGEKADKCWELLRSRAAINLLGNHDLFAAQGRMLIELKHGMSSVPCAEYQEELAHLRGWERVEINGWNLLLCHASPVDVLWEFIGDSSDARLAWAKANGSAVPPDMILVGHTHKPALYRHMHGQDVFMDEALPQMRVDVKREAKILANPGSVGAGANRGSFAVLQLDAAGEPHELRWYQLHQ